jgi:xylose isomerase
MTVGYQPPSPSLLESIRIAGGLGIIQGIEMAQGEGNLLNSGNKKEVGAALKDHGLTLCAVSPNLWGETQWRRGTLSASDPKLRSAATDRIQRGMDLAAELGCDYVGIWPGQDGYDYCFETDYRKAHDWWVEGIEKCADHNPSVRLGLEYKPYEPRTHSLLDTCAKTLLLLRDINRANVGLTLDVGHALFAHENLGEVVALSQREGKLFHLHLNDNYADWDWDLNFGSAHLFEWIELVYWLRRTSYQGWYSIDIFPYRTRAAASVEESIRWLHTIVALVDRLGQEKLDQMVLQGDPTATSKLLRETLFNTSPR